MTVEEDGVDTVNNIYGNWYAAVKHFKKSVI